MSIAQGLREYDQFEELWNLCERLVVDVPRVGERIIYFPQGHLDELKFSTKQEFDHEMAYFNLPSKILCRLLDIQLLVEPKSSQIYTCVTLLPDTESDPTVPDPTPPELQKHEFNSICKILTTSVTGTVGVPSSVISNESMHLGVLSTASHAVMTGTMFVVYYKQRASQFVISLNKYLEAVNNNIYVGMRFKMKFQTEDSLERSFFGTIVEIGHFSTEWLDSEWRSLKVEWEEPAAISRPERVSLWEIEPVIGSRVVNAFEPTIKSKADGKWPTSPLLNDSPSRLAEPGRYKEAGTSALGRFCSWLCCCVK